MCSMQAMTATPMPGMSVQMADSLPKSETNNLPNAERERAFRIVHEHGRKSFVFLAPTRDEALKWVDRLQEAGKAEFPNGCVSSEDLTSSRNNQS